MTERPSEAHGTTLAWGLTRATAWSIGDHLGQAELSYLGRTAIRHGYIYRTARSGEDIVVRRYKLVVNDGEG